MPQLEDGLLKLDQAVNDTFTEIQLVKLLEWRLDQLTRLDGRKYHLYIIYIFEREHLHLNLNLYLFPASDLHRIPKRILQCLDQAALQES